MCRRQQLIRFVILHYRHMLTAFRGPHWSMGLVSVPTLVYLGSSIGYISNRPTNGYVFLSPSKRRSWFIKES